MTAEEALRKLFRESLWLGWGRYLVRGREGGYRLSPFLRPGEVPALEPGERALLWYGLEATPPGFPERYVSDEKIVSLGHMDKEELWRLAPEARAQAVRNLLAYLERRSEEGSVSARLDLDELLLDAWVTLGGEVMARELGILEALGEDEALKELLEALEALREEVEEADEALIFMGRL